MIRGEVNAAYEPVVRLRVQGPGGREREIEAVVDTGFNGFLTLPPDMVRDLGLKRLARGRAVVADGGQQIFDICGAIVSWDGELRFVEADSLNNEPLIGMRLLKGHDLLVQVEVGGSVVIEGRKPREPN